ncbi:MAG: SdrD B-like domain-containing protein [Verrucomicrobiota bacterium]
MKQLILWAAAALLLQMFAPKTEAILPATLGDFVWNDVNGNGIQEPGESGIAGVTIELRDGNTGDLLQTTTTSATGYYTFSMLIGTLPYQVKAVVPSGYVATLSLASGNPENDSNENPTTVTPAFGQTDLSIDFGFLVPSGAIGDFVWLDSNANGIQDSGEPGLEGVPVYLLENETVVQSTVTGPNGFYQFTGLVAGEYHVQVDTPPGTIPTLNSAPGSTAANDSNGSGTTVSLPTSASSDQTIDFGFVIPPPTTATVGDFVWHDANGNGIQESGEPGIASVVIHLRDAYTGFILETTLTDANGYYQFTVQGGAAYLVEAVPPLGYTATLTLASGSTAVTDSNINPAPVTVPAGQADNTIDFGFLIPSGAIGNFVWLDVNDNGIQDSGEPGMDGVTVFLLQNSLLLQTTVTGPNGYYQFSGLVAGDYVVEVNTPPGTMPTANSAPGSTNENDSNGTGTLVHLATSATSDQTVDFGFIIPRPKNPGTGTPGYWKNHPDAWPVESLTIGGVIYTKAAAITGMRKSTKTDMTYVLFQHLVAATLNVWIGNDPECIADTIDAANLWLAGNPLGSGVKASSGAWQNSGESYSQKLDQYNNGLLCAPARD